MGKFLVFVREKGDAQGDPGRSNPRENSIRDDVDLLRDHPLTSRSAVCPGHYTACCPQQGKEEPGCWNGLDDPSRFFRMSVLAVTTF
jgi:hypothetical protein